MSIEYPNPEPTIDKTGDVLPEYRGVNLPRYSLHPGDKMPDHNFGSTETVTSEPAEFELQHPPMAEQQGEIAADTQNPFWPTPEQRQAGREGTSRALETLRNANPPIPRKSE